MKVQPLKHPPPVLKLSEGSGTPGLVPIPTHPPVVQPVQSSVVESRRRSVISKF